MMVSLGIILTAVLCLAYANGANDNFKGVATLLGSRTTDYRQALTWATATTLLGSLTAVLLAGTLLTTFSGRGLVADSLAANADYAAAVALGAGLTVLLATHVRMPISTTHSLIGAMVGAGYAAGSVINVVKLGDEFFLPLLVSPLLAIVGTSMIYPLFSFVRNRCGISSQTCICVGNRVVEVVPASDPAVAIQRAEQLTVSVGESVTCRNQYHGRVLGVQAGPLVDRLHLVSAGLVSFSRGLNDTPKIAALFLLAPQLGGFTSTALVGVFMAAGGVLSARKVAETMSQKITPMNHGQGFSANLITGLIVIAASGHGLPVSTTHVSCGSLFGIGAITGQGRLRMIATILTAWVTTLPVAAILGAVSYGLVTRF